MIFSVNTQTHTHTVHRPEQKQNEKKIMKKKNYRKKMKEICTPNEWYEKEKKNEGTNNITKLKTNEWIIKETDRSRTHQNRIEYEQNILFNRLI